MLIERADAVPWGRGLRVALTFRQILRVGAPVSAPLPGRYNVDAVGPDEAARFAVRPVPDYSASAGGVYGSVLLPGHRSGPRRASALPRRAGRRAYREPTRRLRVAAIQDPMVRRRIVRGVDFGSQAEAEERRAEVLRARTQLNTGTSAARHRALQLRGLAASARRQGLDRRADRLAAEATEIERLADRRAAGIISENPLLR